MAKNYEKRITKARVCGIASALAFVVAVVVLLIALMSPAETYISDGHKIESISILYCKALDIGSTFFDYNTAIHANHEVKITFESDIVDKINYTYEAEFNSEDTAKIALSWMHANYNDYMGEIGVYQEDLSPMFSIIKNKGIINLFIDGSNFTSATAKFVFLDDKEYAGFRNMAIGDIEKLYENKGFSCKTNEHN